MGPEEPPRDFLHISIYQVLTFLIWERKDSLATYRRQNKVNPDGKNHSQKGPKRLILMDRFWVIMTRSVSIANALLTLSCAFQVLCLYLNEIVRLLNLCLIECLPPQTVQLIIFLLGPYYF